MGARINGHTCFNLIMKVKSNKCKILNLAALKYNMGHIWEDTGYGLLAIPTKD